MDPLVQLVNKKLLVTQFFDAVQSQDVIGVIPAENIRDAEMILSIVAEASSGAKGRVVAVYAFGDSSGVRIEAKGEGEEWSPIGRLTGPAVLIIPRATIKHVEERVPEVWRKVVATLTYHRGIIQIQ